MNKAPALRMGFIYHPGECATAAYKGELRVSQHPPEYRRRSARWLSFRARARNLIHAKSMRFLRRRGGVLPANSNGEGGVEMTWRAKVTEPRGRIWMITPSPPHKRRGNWSGGAAERRSTCAARFLPLYKGEWPEGPRGYVTNVQLYDYYLPPPESTPAPPYKGGEMEKELPRGRL
jgi:hypothetical protein